MKTYYEFLNEDFASSLSKFSELYVKPLENNPPKTISQLKKSQLFLEYCEFHVENCLDDFFQEYQETYPSDRMYNRPKVSPEEFDYCDSYLKICDPRDESLFVTFIVSELLEKLNYHIRSIESNISDGKIKIYRAMKVGVDYIKHLESQGNRLGIYWTVDKNLADVYNGHGGVNHPTNYVGDSATVIFETTVNENHINWEKTLFARMNQRFGDDEEEITLFKGTPLKIDLIYDKDTYDDLTTDSVKSKTFYA